MVKKILVPLDGSSLAERALTFAENEAKAHGAILVLLRVINPNFFEEPFSEAELVLIEKYREQAGKYLAQVAETVWNGSLLEAKTLVGEGDPARAILDAAKAEQVDLITMTTHGFSGMGHIVWGSVAGKVAKACTVPLLLIRTVPVVEPTQGAKAASVT